MPDVQNPLIIHAVERFGWCFANIAEALQQQHSQGFRFKTMQTGRIAREECDVLVCFWWDHTLRAKANVKCKGVVTCLYDELSWHINEQSRAQFKLVLRNTDVLAVCNENIANRVREIYGALCPTIILIEDGVDTELFHPMELPTRFSAGWTGNSSRHTPGGPDDLKGLGVIREAAGKIAGVELHVLDAAAGGSWPLKDMPKFYNRVSTIVIGSANEGTPNPLLEGLSCGRPVVSTKCGLAPKVIKDGCNGFLVERNARAVGEALSHLASLGRKELEAMGRAARKTAMEWSWTKKASVWPTIYKVAMQNGVVRQMNGGLSPKAYVPVEITQPAPRPRREVPERPRVLAISDVPGWAFHTNMMDMAETLEGKFEVDHWFVADWQTTGHVPSFEDYDVVFSVYHRWRIDHLLPWDRTVGSLRALWFFPETPARPSDREYALVNRYRAFHVVTRQNYDELKDHCKNVMYLTNPVNMRRFSEMTPVENEVIASWNGNARHASGGGVDVKGFWSLIVPVVKAVKMPFEYVEYNTNRIAPAEMPEFYQKSNVAICMSLYEGASNSVMEAMASGLALITTDAGNTREMHEAQLRDFGESGVMIIERSQTALIDALKVLRDDPKRVRAMGAVNREEIIRRWSWEVWRDGYIEFLRKGLP